MTIGDTALFIDLMNPERPHHEGALEMAAQHEELGRPLYMTAITRFELFRGSELYFEPVSERVKIQRILDRYPTLPLEGSCADRGGRIHGALARDGQAIGLFDALIASIALENEQVLATRNLGGFERVQGLKVVGY